jgi:hypothetical protein
MSERYTYIPLIGIFIIISWGLKNLLESMKYGNILFAFSAVSLGSAQPVHRLF